MKSLAAALVEAQKKMPVVHKTAKANYGNYATLDQLIEKTKPVLIDNGLAIAQFPTETSTGAPGLRTILMHNESGESIESTVPLLLNGKNDMQTLGGAITYARRYGWAAVLGIANDEDDDGNSASAPGTGATQQVSTGLGGQGGQAAGSSPAKGSPAASNDVKFKDGDFESPAVPAIGNGYGLAAEIDAAPGGKKYVGLQVRDLKPGQLKWFAGLWKPEDGEAWRPRNQAQQLLKRAVTAYMEDPNATVQLAEPDENEGIGGGGDSDIPFLTTIDGLGN